MNEHREWLLSTLPVTERRVTRAGISTPVLEGGEGEPVLLLHGPGGSAIDWERVIPGLVTTNRVVAPDLPGQGESELDAEPLDADRTLTWLDELVDATCQTPPALVAHALGGPIAARYACDRHERLRSLVLVDSLGLVPFEPAPAFGAALQGFLAEPSAETHDDLWRQCAYDLDGLRDRVGDRWEALEAYHLDRAQDPGAQAALGTLMGIFGLPAIPAEELDRIQAPTTLIWGRHDLATPLAAAEAVAARHGWAISVIEDCADDPPMEQPGAFVDALRRAFAVRATEGASR